MVQKPHAYVLPVGEIYEGIITSQVVELAQLKGRFILYYYLGGKVYEADCISP